jgi:hypothetical protein
MEWLEHLVRVDATRVVAGWPGYRVGARGYVSGPRIGCLSTSTTRGYHCVSLVHGDQKALARVHRLVAEAFLGSSPFDGALVAHNDGNKDNNAVTNLRWASAVENQADRVRHNTKTRGSDVKWSKLVESDIPTIVARAQSGENYSAIARDFGVSVSTISLIKQGRIWRHAQ